MNQAYYENFQDKEQEEFRRRRKVTVDEVTPSEQQPEVEHQIKSKNSHTGYLNLIQRGWRDSRDDGFFSYEMKVQPDQQMYLVVTYFGNDSTLHIYGKSLERDFSILVNGTEIARQKLEANQPGSLFDVTYDIPLSLTTAKEKIEVKFASELGQVAGGIYGVRIVNAKD